MTDGQNLFLILCLIYGLECLYWIPKTSFLFRGIWDKKAAPVLTETLPGNSQGGVAWSFPFPSLGIFYKVQSIEGRWDLAEAKQRYEKWKSEIRLLRIAANGLFVYLFIFAPLLASFKGFMTVWWRLLIGIEVLALLVTVFFFIAHRRLYPDEKGMRWQRAFISLLYPIAAIRSPDALAVPLFKEWHPLVVASLVCPRVAFEKFASLFLRREKFPLRGVIPNPERLMAIEKFLKKKLDKNLDKLLAPETKHDTKSMSYCPRCWTEFRKDDGECSDCPGVILRKYE